jgi:small GTP-binding protein
MGNEVKLFNDIFGSSENGEKHINELENNNEIYNKSNNIYTINEDELFLIKGFRQHYMLTLVNLAGKNIIILGDSKIGKTKIFELIFEKEHLNENIDESTNNNSEQNYAYFEEKNFIIEGLEININIWDTPGEVKHQEANKHFIKDSIISYLCFHFKSPKSFEIIKNYYMKMVKEINGNNSFMVLVGIKNEMFDDNNDNIPIKDIKTFAEDNNILFYSVSLSESNSIRYLFNDSIKKYVLLKSKLSFKKI